MEKMEDKYSNSNPTVQMILYSDIAPDPNQPRQSVNDESLQELSQSIHNSGIITPISVRSDKEQEGQYIINHGERRWRAAQQAGLEWLPCIVFDDMHPVDQLLENLQRENIDPIEQADFVLFLLKNEEMTAADVGDRLGKGRDWVSFNKKIGEAPEDIKDLFRSGVIADSRAIADLARAYDKNPDEIEKYVAELAASDTTVTKPEIKRRLEAIANPDQQDDSLVKSEDDSANENRDFVGEEETQEVSDQYSSSEESVVNNEIKEKQEPLSPETEPESVNTLEEFNSEGWEGPKTQDPHLLDNSIGESSAEAKPLEEDNEESGHADDEVFSSDFESTHFEQDDKQNANNENDDQVDQSISEYPQFKIKVSWGEEENEQGYIVYSKHPESQIIGVENSYGERHELQADEITIVLLEN